MARHEDQDGVDLVDGTQKEVVRAEGVTLAVVLPVWESAGAKFVALLRSLDPTSGAIQVPHLKWTVGETAAHMLSIVRRGLNDFRRSDTREGLADLNDLCIDEIEEREPTALADWIESGISKTARVLRPMSEEDAAESVFPLHAGLQANIPTALSYAMFDFLVHGYDIAVAVEKAWALDPSEAGVTLRACFPALRPWVNQTVLEGPAQVATLSFLPDVTLALHTGDGTWRVDSAGSEANASTVDAAELLLAIAGRESSGNPEIARVAEWFAPI